MKELIKAILTVLKADSTLIATVPANDIHTTYNPEAANYPCVTVEIEAGQALNLPDGVEDDLIAIDMFSNVNNAETWDIHALVKGLLHNQALSISNTAVKIHSIQLAKKTSNGFSQKFGTWNVKTSYKILYTEV